MKTFLKSSLGPAALLMITMIVAVKFQKMVKSNLIKTTKVPLVSQILTKIIQNDKKLMIMIHFADHGQLFDDMDGQVGPGCEETSTE